MQLKAFISNCDKYALPERATEVRRMEHNKKRIVAVAGLLAGVPVVLHPGVCQYWLTAAVGLGMGMLYVGMHEATA